MKRILAIVALAAGPALAHVGPHPEAGVAFDPQLGAVLDTGLRFVDARGVHETLGQAMDRMPTVLLLGYVRCEDLCSVTLPGAATALDRAGLAARRDYRAVFASIDAREGPEVLARGAQRIPPADRAGWSFLGGNEVSVRALAQAVGFRYRYEPDRDTFAHPEGIVVLSPEGRVSRYLFGASFDPADLRLALAEAGQGRTGSLSDRLLLLCYHFDPTTGRYTARILDALRIAIGVCAVAAGVFMWRVLRPRGGGDAA